jgi:hypothetical protein
VAILAAIILFIMVIANKVISSMKQSTRVAAI